MKKYLPLVITAIIIGGIAFYGGMQYGKNQAATATPSGLNDGSRGGAGGGRQRGTNGNFIGGIIAGKDDKSITVQSMDGSSKIIFFSDSTKIMKAVDGALADLAAGKQVTISGTANPDGSINAQTIQLRAAALRPPEKSGIPQ